MRKMRFSVYIIVGLAMAWAIARAIPHRVETAAAQPAGSGFSSYDLSVPPIMPVAAYDTH
jgi:hypothetical protein